MQRPTHALHAIRPMSWISTGQQSEPADNHGDSDSNDNDNERRPRKLNRRSTMGPNQLPSLQVADTARNTFTAMAGEFVGTFLFLFFAFAGTQISNSPRATQGLGTESDPNGIAPPDFDSLIYSSLSFGFSLMVNIWAFFRITGGLFNPAVNLALCLVGGVPILRGVSLFIAQIAGGLSAAGIVSVLFPGDLRITTRLGGGTSIVQGLFIEMFLTAQLVFVVIMLAVVKHKSTFLAPVAIGLTFFVMELVGNYFTGGSLNPARTLGPDAVTHDFPGYHWIYWVGPLLGSLLACGFYSFLTHFQYESVNPGQDFNEWEAKIESETGGGITGQTPGATGSAANMRYSDMTLPRTSSLREMPDEEADGTQTPGHLQPNGSLRSSRHSVSFGRPSLNFPAPPPGDEQV